MAIFRYEAADVSGKVLRGAMDAPTAQEVVRRLAERGYNALQVQAPAAAPAATAAAATPRPRGLSLGAAVAPEDLGLFFRQMASLTQVGFTVSAALSDLGPRTAHRGIRAAAREMAAGTARGGALSEEMARHPGLFAAHVVGLVAAGEAGGFLPFAFEEAALHAEQDAALRQGLWLPKLLIWQAVWSVLLLAPLFPRIFTEGLAAYGRAVLTWSVPVGIGLHLAAALAGWAWRQPFAAGVRDRLSLALPVTGRLHRMRALASFTRMLRRLLLAGISPEPAFVAAARAVPNGVLARHLLAGTAVVRAGQGLDAAVAATGLMAHDPLQLSVTGQRSGQWTEMLDRVTTYYQEEAAGATESARRAQKRLGTIITILATGYVTIAVTHGTMSSAFTLVDTWFPNE